MCQTSKDRKLSLSVEFPGSLAFRLAWTYKALQAKLGPQAVCFARLDLTNPESAPNASDPGRFPRTNSLAHSARSFVQGRSLDPIVLYQGRMTSYVDPHVRVVLRL